MRSFTSFPWRLAPAAVWLWVEKAAAQNLEIIPKAGLPGCDFATGRHTAACIPQFIGHVIVQVFQVISALFILNILFAGYQYAMGSISGEKEGGKDRLKWSIVGLIVSVTSFLILDIVLTVIAPDV